MTIRHAGKERLVHFVSGHLDLTEHEFNEHYKDKINRAAAMGHYFVVGDAPGCDSMAQRYINYLTSFMTVYHMLEKPRNLFGAQNGLIGGFLTDEERDAAMTEASDADIAWVRPSGSKRHSSGTQKNLDRRKAKNLRLFLEERATWERVNIRENMDDAGHRPIRRRHHRRQRHLVSADPQGRSDSSGSQGSRGSGSPRAQGRRVTLLHHSTGTDAGRQRQGSLQGLRQVQRVHCRPLSWCAPHPNLSS